MALRWTARAWARHDRLVLALIAAFLCLFTGRPAWAATVAGVEVAADHITIRFDDRVAGASGSMLTGPRRIAIDVDGAAPGAARLPGGGPVSAVTQHAQGREATRLEFALGSPAVIGEGRFAADGRALTVSLRPVDAHGFAAAASAQPLDFFPFTLGGHAPAYRVSVPVPAATRLPLPKVRGDRSRPLVVIDAGHGGVDPGAINPVTGLREKDVTLAVAKAIRDAMLKSGRVRVALTRDDDRYLVLRERFGIARRLHADLFISIHCDSTVDPAATGASVYTLSEVASDKEAARLASRENKSDVIAGVDLDEAPADVSSILIDLTQRETMNNSAAFARLLGREAQPLMPLKANFHRMASLMVLKAPDMPSILFETGYISNPKDAAFLNSADGRDRIAEGVTRAVEVHFARRLAAR